jgi:hypothetical protein
MTVRQTILRCMPSGTGSRPPDVESSVRFIRTLALIAGALLLAACGADDPGVTTGEPPPPASGDQHPGDPEAVVLSVTDVGGFVPSDRTFTDLPRLLVTGDGRVIQEGPVMAIYPGPLLPNVLQRSITEAGIQRLIDLADEHGLLVDVTYTRPGNIADAGETIVTITVNGETFEHRAYALGLGGAPDGGETDAARARLFDFVVAATDLASDPAADEIGPEEPFRSDSYLIRAFEAETREPTGDAPIDLEPTLVDWPADAPVRLAAAAECAEVPTDRFARLFEDANQLTRFVDDGVAYSLAVTPRVPGRSCSP